MTPWYCVFRQEDLRFFVSMDSLETLLAPIRHSPRLVEAVDLLQEQVRHERERRVSFYRDMTPEQKVEFIDGEVILHSPARKGHLDSTKWLLQLLNAHVSVNGLGTVMSEKCLCVFPRNDYEPDIVFFGLEKADTLSSETLKFPVPDFVVEVLSESTKERDRGVKFEDYAAHGVREYWIVDCDASVIEQYRLKGDHFELVHLSSDGELRSDVIDGFSMPVAAAFDEEENLKILRRLLD